MANNISSARRLWELMLSNVSGQDPKNVFPRYEGRNRPGITGISGINVFGGGQGVSVVPKPQFSPNQEPITERIPTSREQVKGVMDLPDEKSKAFSRIHEAYSTGADFGYESGWLERLNVPEEYIGLYMAVPDAAKKYAYENPTDAVLEQFEEKYGFPLNISIPL